MNFKFYNFTYDDICMVGNIKGKNIIDNEYIFVSKDEVQQLRRDIIPSLLDRVLRESIDEGIIDEDFFDSYNCFNKYEYIDENIGFVSVKYGNIFLHLDIFDKIIDVMTEGESADDVAIILVNPSLLHAIPPDIMAKILLYINRENVHVAIPILPVYETYNKKQIGYAAFAEPTIEHKKGE